MNQSNKYLHTGKSSCPKMPLEKMQKPQGPKPLSLPIFSWNSRTSRNGCNTQSMNPTLTLTSLGLFFSCLLKNYCSYAKGREIDRDGPAAVTLSPTVCLGHFWVGRTIYLKALLLRISECRGEKGQHRHQKATELGAGVACALNWALLDLLDSNPGSVTYQLCGDKKNEIEMEFFWTRSASCG